MAKGVCVCSTRFLLKKKPDLVKSNSSARLLEEVLLDKDTYDQLVQSSSVRLVTFTYLEQNLAWVPACYVPWICFVNSLLSLASLPFD